MKQDWSLSALLEGLHNDIHLKLNTIRETLAHPGTKGDASERVWLELFEKYLPQRYKAINGHVVDSKGNFSYQIDVIIFDRQYTPFIFNFQDTVIVPAESVYAVFEAKQTLNAGLVRYAQDKVASVRKLHRTSLPIPHAGGTFPSKPLIPIYGGVLTFESDWSPPMGKYLIDALEGDQVDGRLELGCVAAHGYFSKQKVGSSYDIIEGGKPATSFLFKLISELQFSGTVPMIDVLAYSDWLNKK
jgi:hypothetical protein